MKKAVCLYNDVIQHDLISVDQRIDALSQCFGEDVDFYIHSGTPIHPKTINPDKLSGIEISRDESGPERVSDLMSGSKGIKFNRKMADHVKQIFHKWYSFKRSYELAVNNKEYDCFAVLDINFIMRRKFYSDEKFLEDPRSVYFPLWNMNEFKCAICDLIAIGNQESMGVLSEIYDRISEYVADGSDFEKHIMSLNEVAHGVAPSRIHLINNQTILRWHSVNVNQMDIKFWGLKGLDFDLSFMHGKNETGYPNGVPLDTLHPVSFELGQSNLSGPVGIH